MPTAAPIEGRRLQLTIKQRGKPGAHFAVLAVISIIICLVGCASSRAESNQHAANGGHFLWFVTSAAIARLHELDPTLTDAMLNHPGSYMLGGGPVRRLWAAQYRAQYESYATFAEDVRHRKVEPRVNAVAYNPEVWSSTPEAEQHDPVTYAQMFTALAHEHGWTAIIAPSCGLLRKMPGGVHGPILADCATRLLAPIAPHADIVDFEAQSVEHDPSLYAQRVIAAATLVKGVNPRVKFIAQLSTSQSRKASPEELVEAARSVAPYVDGFWLHVDSDQPASVAEAHAFLQRYRAAAGG
jgi:hypothetical protein